MSTGTAIRPATPAQVKTLQAIDRCFQRTGFMPGVRELAAEYRCSAGTMQAHLEALTRKGYIYRTTRAHGIQLLPPAYEILGARPGPAVDSKFEYEENGTRVVTLRSAPGRTRTVQVTFWSTGGIDVNSIPARD